MRLCAIGAPKEILQVSSKLKPFNIRNQSLEGVAQLVMTNYTWAKPREAAC